MLAGAAAAVVATLFVSPTTTDRVFYASGVLLVAAFAICARHLFVERHVRRFVVGACLAIFGYHVARFVETAIATTAANTDRIARLEAAPPGSVAVVPAYAADQRSRWHLGDDFAYYPWLRSYVGGELYDLARVDLDRRDRTPAMHLVAATTASVPTYRQLQRAPQLAEGDLEITAVGLFDDPAHRPIVVLAHHAFVDGHPLDAPNGHFIHIRRATLPAQIESSYLLGCDLIDRVERGVDDSGDLLLSVDERYCRGPFTAILCEPDRCWVAGWC